MTREEMLELAELVADVVYERMAAPTPRGELVDAATLAGLLGVTPDFVYRHAGELGARRLGDGPRARLRFDPVEAERRLTACAEDRESGKASDGVVEPKAVRRRRRGPASAARLLPIRGLDGSS